MCSSPFAGVVFSGLLKLKHRRSDNVHKVAQLKTGLSPISPPTQSSFPSAMYSHASSGHGGEGGKVPRTPLVLLVYQTRVLWPPSWDNGAVLRKWPCGRGRPGAPTALRPRPLPCGHAHGPAATPTALRPRPLPCGHGPLSTVISSMPAGRLFAFPRDRALIQGTLRCV